MSDIGKYTPLKTIVSYYLDENNSSMGDFDRVWVIGLRGLTKLNQQISASPKTVRLPVLPNKTVPIPADCINWTKIGLLNARGEVSTLKINNALTTFRDNNPNRLQDLTPNINDSVGQLTSSPFYFNYYYDSSYYNLFGAGNGLIQFGDCRVDEQNGVVVLSPEFKYDSIIFEYISAPEKDNDYMVLTVLQEAIIGFIGWKLKTNSRENFYAEAVEARRALPGKRVTLQQINQVIRESTGFKIHS